MLYRLMLCLGGLLALVCSSHALAAEQPTPRPNIIVIMSDDMGFSDLGCYGGEIATPQLDALAANGVRFTQFYNTARCCPTRASLLTGLYPHQAGMGHMTQDRGFDGYRGTLSRQAVTIAEAIRPAGYRTYMCGKWHVTSQTRPNGDQSNWPLQRGFEKFYGTLAGAGSFYDPTTLCRQNTHITPANDQEYAPEQYYYTDAISDNAVRYLQQHVEESPDKPFFLYVAYTAAHWPMHALEQDVAKQRGRYDAGYRAYREARLARMKELQLVPDDTELSPDAESWEKVANQAWEARCMEVFAAMIGNMDAGIGRIVAQLNEAKQLDNTLILFLQDNGACAEGIGRANNGAGPNNLQPFGKDEPQPRVTPPMQTRDGRWVRTGPSVLPGPADTYIAYGRGWANVSNTPFREYKHWVHEGGISTPLIAHWPTGIPQSRAGKLERQPGHLIDIMATCVDLAGAEYPTEFAGQPIKPREGVSLRPAFSGESLQRAQPIFWEHEGNRAVRDGRWKLVAKENGPWELYDIDADRVESSNLAATHPALVQKLAAQWDAYAERANVLPLGAWRGGLDADNQPARRRFVLKADEQLERPQAPAIGQRGFAIKANIAVTEPEQSGVIVAQGGNAHGFSLYLKQGVPTFRVRSTAGVFEIAGKQALQGKHTLEAGIGPQGRLRLHVDGEAAAEPAPFAGDIDAVVIELDER